MSGISLQTNVNALVAEQNMNVNNTFQSKTIQQLTSGYRINSSGDDAAGLAVANKYASSIAELTQGVSNGNDGVAQLQIMDGGMSNISQILDRLQTLATQSATGTFTGNRATLNNEFQTDVGEIDRQAQSIGLNTGGIFAKNLGIYLGAGSGSQTQSNGVVNVDLSGATVDSSALGLRGMSATSASGFDLSTAEINSIIADVTNSASTTAGQTDFKFFGAGFGTGVDVKVATGGVTSQATLLANINAALTSAGDSNTAFQKAGITASIVPDANGKSVLTFTSANGAFQVQAGDVMANAFLGNVGGNGVTGDSLTSTVTGHDYDANAAHYFANGQAVTYTVAGGGLASPQSFTVTAGNATTDAAAMATQIVNDVATHAALTNAGISANTTGGSLNFVSSTGQPLQVGISGDTGSAGPTLANLLGYGAFQAGSANQLADATSVQAAQAYTADGATGGNTYLDLSLGGGAATRLTVAVGATDTISTVAGEINAAIAAAGTSSNWQKAGIVASVSGGNLVLSSTNGTAFRVGSTNDGTTTTNLGFNSIAGALADTVAAYAGPATAAAPTFLPSNSAGDNQLANSGGTATAVTFTNMTYGSDTQAITISAANAAGVSQSVAVQLTSGYSGNGWSIDSAVNAINAAIQGSGNATLQGISAVKADIGGTEEIQFVGPAQFNVAIGKTTNGTGLTAQGSTNVQGTTLSSTQVGTGGALDISTESGAQSAVTAITNAVQTLGSSQAEVGKGENVLAFAISLATSQITNFSVAESNIRDADVAQEAANLSKAQVLQQAAVAAMAQANSAPQVVLTLLRG